MSSRIVLIIVLIIGLGIGSIVPAATSWWYDNQRDGLASNSFDAETVLTKDSAKVTYHFGFEQGVLSVIEETPGESDKVIVTGLNIQAWPKEMLDMAPKVEFYSLDEVQSFIDTVNEPLWLE